jgi:hypothetical protein
MEIYSFRVTVSQFEWLLSSCRQHIEKMDTQMRRSIRADKRLAITLKFLATGTSFYNLSGEFVVGETTVGTIVLETCAAIISVFEQPNQVPRTEMEWKKIAKDFYEKWDYPNTIGALDGKHVLIEKPEHSGSQFHNYKDNFNIV